jgi:Peptidase family S41/N-terminal domain of Peptidase_S41 in eukaryotic IRBP
VAVEQAELDRLERAVDREIKSRFPDGAVQRAVLLQHSDDTAIPPGQLLVRVYIPAAGGPDDQARALAAWQAAHAERMAEIRRELSLRLPPARLLEFAVDGAGPADPRISMPDDGSLTAEQPSGREIATEALALLRAHYVFPERAEQAAAVIEDRIAAGEYDLDEITLTERLTNHLQDLLSDRHLRVVLASRRPGRAAPGPGPGPVPRPRPRSGRRGSPESGADRPAWRTPGRFDNYGIRRVERLDGGVGYIDLRRMAVPENAGPAIAAAMELVAGTEALIFDLRRNGGGSVDGVNFWCSYLFPDGRTHLNGIFNAETGETRQFWSLAYVPGSRYLDRPVYVLSSGRTFSGGEDFCYTLQAQGRAHVIGETTGGGAHLPRRFQVSPAVAIGIPSSRSVNPVTGTNWQDTGVTPDIVVPEAEALDVAYGEALRHVLSADPPPPVLEEAREALATLPAASDPDVTSSA